MIVNCPLCELRVQRTPHGTLSDGLAEHYTVCHPGEISPGVGIIS